MSGPRTERGASAVEFAFVVPIIFALMFGILQYGYHYWALETAAATAREAARRYAVGTDPVCTLAEARDYAGTAALGPVTVSGVPVAPKVGDVFTVTVGFQSLDMHLFPLPDNGYVTESATVRVENVPATPPTC